MRRIVAGFLFVFLFNSVARAAQAPSDPNTKSGTAVREVVVKAPKTDPKSPFLPDVQGTKIYSGKKTSVARLEEIPEVANNNFRQAVAKVPGVMLSEETTPLFSLGYRGLPPGRAQYIQVMKDGVPIHADMFGYPESYYVPPLQTVERMEFVKGGASLMYGPQPGGALNFVTRMPDVDTPARLYTENMFGTDEFFSTYEALTGRAGPLGYLGYFHERQGEGFRHSNSDFEVISSGLKTTLNQTGDSRLTMSYDEYHENHGEPGGLTRQQFDADPSVTLRAFDCFALERYYGSVRYEKEFSEKARFDFLTYGGHYRRYSKRQNGGGFGTIPTGGTNTIEEQDFYNLGFEPRLRRDYELFGENHSFTAGIHIFFSHSPRADQTGATPGAESGALVRHAIRNTQYLSVFIENLFRFGRLSITPGVRLEHVWQRVQDEFDNARVDDKKNFDFAPLFGLGVSYDIAKGVQAYANVSQSYRPKLFSEAVPTAANQIVSGDLEEAKGEQYDFGLRGAPVPFWHWDIDYFVMRFRNQIATVDNVVTNAGRSLHQGMELFTDVDVVGAYDYLSGSNYADTLGSFSPFVTLTLLDARFTSGPTDDRRPQYAPQYNLRFGTIYQWHDRVKVSLISTFVDDHFGNDNNTAQQAIPSYKVWDLTAEWNFLKNAYGAFDVGIFGGIYNLFDEKYYARVTTGGIDPAYGRNIYGGVKIKLG